MNDAEHNVDVAAAAAAAGGKHSKAFSEGSGLTPVQTDTGTRKD